MVTTLGPTVAGVELAKGRWTLDANHAAVSFSIRHLGLSRVRGRFERFAATLDVGGTLAETQIIATIDMASVNTGQPDRDVHLRSTDFFSVEQHPEMRFVSTALSGEGEMWQLAGELTLNGRTHPVTLAVEFNGAETFPGDGKQHAGFSATGKIRRSLYGIELGLTPLGMGKLALGDEVQVELEIQFVAPGQPA
jgi:polyisoprenoid-binding protein YceI